MLAIVNAKATSGYPGASKVLSVRAYLPATDENPYTDNFFYKMGGHSDPEIPKVPDWRMYRVEDVPELMALRRALASHNLKDPWLRNYVWRYTQYSQKKNINRSIFSIMTCGFKLGFAAAVLTTVAEKAFFSFYYGDSNDSHH